VCVFHVLMHRSAVPPPLASRLDWKGHHASACRISLDISDPKSTGLGSLIAWQVSSTSGYSEGRGEKLGCIQQCSCNVCQLPPPAAAGAARQKSLTMQKVMYSPPNLDGSLVGSETVQRPTTTLFH